NPREKILGKAKQVRESAPVEMIGNKVKQAREADPVGAIAQKVKHVATSSEHVQTDND
ncbi:hypothetical protein HCJ27_14510, partial [Listeria sp. FSL L7-1435]|nr:hypothetical protein [Listeria cossartiae subsp. cossartiae]